MRYTPKPIDTSKIQLPAEILALTERLAEHNHEIWSKQKLKDGWKKGPTSPKDRTHAMLIPYDDLPESEKEYDRNTALESIRAIIALGYDLVKR